MACAKSDNRRKHEQNNEDNTLELISIIYSPTIVGIMEKVIHFDVSLFLRKTLPAMKSTEIEKD